MKGTLEHDRMISIFLQLSFLIPDTFPYEVAEIRFFFIYNLIPCVYVKIFAKKFLYKIFIKYSSIKITNQIP